MDLLICAYGTCISIIMFELFTGCRADGMDGEPDDNKIDEELRKIEPKLAAKKGPDGKITKPGLSI